MATTTTPPSPEDQVAAAYRDIMRRFFERLQDPKPGDPDIARYHTGPSLLRVQQRAVDLAKMGAADRPTEHGLPRVTVRDVKVMGATATLSACIIDDTLVIVVATGQIVNDKVSSKLADATLRFEAGRWKLATNISQGEWPGRKGCWR